MATHSSRRDIITKCSDCTKYAADPINGHFKCAKHRSCSGTQEWQPQECEICMLFKHNVTLLPNDEKDSVLENLYRMLQETSNELSNNDVTWNYENNFYSFMELQRQD